MIRGVGEGGIGVRLGVAEGVDEVVGVWAGALVNDGWGWAVRVAATAVSTMIAMDSSMESVGVGDGVPAPQAFKINTTINPIAVNVP
jgi:hypothetical protein